MFYPIEPLPGAFRMVAWCNPITWQVDVLRYATIGLGAPSTVVIEAALFVVFGSACFAGALTALRRQD
jgi:ABC-type multidrug transport system permease subunit